jgi:hypothetical protein
MRPILATLAAALLLPGGSARALTFFDLSTGDEGLLPDARSIALGRTRVAEGAGAFAGAANPAWLAGTRGLSAALGGSVLKLKETRSTPAYDSFDGFLVESIYALNDEYTYEGGAGVAAGVERRGRGFGIGLSRTPVRDFQYAYSEEVRDNNAFTQPRDGLLATNEVRSEGVLRAWSIAAAGDALPQLSLGVALQLFRGDQDLVMRTRFEQEDRVESSRVERSDLGGFRWVAGAAWQPHHSVTAAAVWRPAIGLHGTYRLETVSGDSTAVTAPGVRLKYPQEITLGAAWRPRAKLRTTVRLEASWVEWSDYEDTLADATLDDVWDARLGVEHVFYNGFPLRFGIRYAPAPLDEEVATTAFTFGGGLDVGPLRADLAFEVANRRYRFEDLFDDAMFGGASRVPKDIVEESGTSAFLTLGAGWPLFGG